MFTIARKSVETAVKERKLIADPASKLEPLMWSGELSSR